MPVDVSGFVIYMKVKIKSTLPLPVATLCPEGGEPLYEEVGTGLRLTASDFAAKHGYADVKEFLEALSGLNVRATLDFKEAKPND
jgi:hypothetical protein